MLEFFAEYYCGRVNDIVSVLGSDKDDNDRRKFQNTLTLLHRQNLIHRIAYFDMDNALPTRTYVYGLKRSMAKKYEGKTFDEHSERTVDHELAITQFHISLKKELPKKYLLTWYQSNIKRTINPDAYFSITDLEDPSKATYHYFLEIERAKIGNVKDGEPSIVRKLNRYYELYDTDAAQKDWGFRRFRVITVVRNSDKMYNLCARTQKHRMFWMTTEQLIRESITKEIFHTPKDYGSKTYSLLNP